MYLDIRTVEAARQQELTTELAERKRFLKRVKKLNLDPLSTV